MGHQHGDRTANQRANETATAHGRDYSQRPLVVTWELTQACALACDHCRADASPDCHPDELSTAQAHALFDQVAAFGDPAPFLVFSGGDPLERDDLLELVRAAAERGVPPAVTPATTPALDRTTVERLAAAGVGRMAVSVDGATPATHDSFRGESGTFERALRAARAAADAGMTVQINTTVTAVTASELPAIAELAESLGAAMWEVFFLVPTGRGAALKQLAPERAGEIVGWLYERSREASYRVITVEAPFYRRVAQQRGATPGRVGTTGAGNGFVFVSHTGEVFPSGFLPLSVGNVRDRSVVDIYRSAELMQQLRDPSTLTGPCGACPASDWCGGSRSRAYATAGDPTASDPLCPWAASRP